MALRSYCSQSLSHGVLWVVQLISTSSTVLLLAMSLSNIPVVLLVFQQCSSTGLLAFTNVGGDTRIGPWCKTSSTTLQLSVYIWRLSGMISVSAPALFV